MSPLPWSLRLLEMAAALSAAAVELLLQSTLVIALGLTAAWLLRGRGPAIRSAIYRATLAAIVACPAATGLISAMGLSAAIDWLPSLRPTVVKQVQPESDLASTGLARAAVNENEGALAPDPFVGEQGSRANGLPADRIGDPFRGDARFSNAPSFPSGTPSASNDRRGAVLERGRDLTGSGVKSSRAATPTWAVQPAAAALAACVAVLWTIVSAIFALRLVLDHYCVLALCRGAPAADAGDQRLCQELAAKLGIAVPRLLRTPYLSGPCLTGFWRHTILLPEESSDVPLSSVLIHELAHLRRGDCRWNLLRHAVKSVLFFQPLLWRLSRRMEEAAEEVCDDHVVHWGADRAVYADGLVRLAEQTTRAMSAVVPLVTFRSLLGQRVQRILDRSHRLSLKAGMRALCAIAASGLAVTILVGLFAPAGRSDATVAPPDESPKNNAAEGKQPEEAKNPAESSTDLKRLTGTVLLPNGKPAAGAHLILVGRLRQSSRAIDFSATQPIVLAQKQSDAAGCFQLAAVDLSSPRYVSVHLLARSADSGVAWARVDTDNPETNYVIKLPEPAPARGRLINLEGKPVAGIHINVEYIRRSTEVDLGMGDGLVVDRGLPPEVWPSGTITDADGWFTVRGIPADADLSLHVDQEPYAPEQWLFTSDSKDPSTRVRALTPAQIVTGIVVAADTGKPIANSPISAYQRFDPLENRGMMGVVGKTDEQGHFRLNPYAAKAYTVTAIGPEQTPYLAKRIEFDWNETERVHEMRIELPRGVLVHGRVTEETNSQPVARVTVRYTAQWKNAYAKDIPLDGVYQPTELSDEQGRFSIAVPAGPGHLTVKSATGEHVLKELDELMISAGRPGGSRLYVNADAAIDLPADARDFAVQFRLHRGETIKGEMLRSDGQAAERLLMVHRAISSWDDEFHANSPVMLAGNRFEIRGVPPDGGFPAYFLDPDAKQGKLFAARGSDAGKALRVELEHCGSLSMRFLDADAKPVVGLEPSLMIVFTPGKLRWDVGNTANTPRADETFISNFDRVNCRNLMTDSKGRITFPALIPGVTYRLLDISDKTRDQQRWKYREITVKAGEHLELPDIVIRNPDVLRYAEENWLKKRKEQAAKTVAATPAGNSDDSSKQMPTGTFSAVEAPTVEKDVGAAMQQRAAAIGQMPAGTTSAVQAPTTERAMSNAAAGMHEHTAATATSEKPSGAASDDAPLQLRGQVVAPDGKPVAGAKLFLMFWSPGSLPEREVKPKAVANAQGRFEFAVKRSDFGLAAGNDWIYSRIVATADGFGIAVGLIADFDVSGDVRQSQPAQVVEYFAKRLTGKQPVLRLATDDAPLTGRIVSLEGQPIAGARVALNEISINEQGEQGNLDTWEKATKEPQADYYSLRTQAGLEENAPQLSLIVPAATSDRDGRFTLHGIGRERVVRLMVSGAGIETKLIRARTRNGEKVVVPNEWRSRADGQVDEYYANGFTHVVAPSNAVVGKVTDRATGKPLAGVTILSQKLHGIPVHGWGQDFIRTVTNADGQYRLEGMPLGDDSEIGAFTLDQPYLPINKRVRIDVGSKQVQLDFQLPRGIWVEGQVTDKTTGKPLSGTVEYFVFSSNPNYKKLGRSDNIDVDLRDYHRAGADGRFRIPALPGPGIIGLMADDNQTYSSRGAGAEKIAEGDTKMGALMFPTAPYYCTAVNFNVLTAINPPENAGVVKLDFALSSGATVNGKLIDADGKPIVGALYCGDSPEFETWRSTEQDSFRVYSYEPNKPRRLVFFEPKRNLAAIYMLSGDPPKSLVVRLEPAGSVRGRLLDEHGSPLAGAMLIPALRPAREALTLSVSDLPLPIPPNSERPDREPATDDEGRFEIHGLIPGKDYLLRASREGHPGFVGQLPDSITVRAGDTKDLGEVTPKPVNSADDVEAMNAEDKLKAKSDGADGAKSSSKDSDKTSYDQPATAAASSQNDSVQAGRKTDDDLISVHGRVLDPLGKQVAGADVAAIQGYWKIGHNSVQLAATKSDETGRFTIEFRKSQLVAGRGEPTRTVIIFASTPGAKYGMAWLSNDSLNPGEEVALRLVRDEPIDGQIVDLEGRPVASVDVKVTSLNTNANSDLTTWLGALRRAVPFFGSQSYDRPDHFLYTDFAGPWNTKTDAGGRFRLTGLGHDRIAVIKISGGGIATTELKVVTRTMEPIKVDTTSLVGFRESATYYGSHFQFAAEPSQPIEGVVRDAKTGQSLAGVRVVSNKFTGGVLSGLYWIETVSDRQGKYRIDGMPKDEGNRVIAVPADGQPYFMREFDVPTGPGLEPVKFDLAMHRGVLIQGRVSEKATGAPVEGALMYYIPWPDNPNIDDVADFARGGSRHDDQFRYQTDRDGRYQLVGVPGRGLVEVTNVRVPRPIPPGQGLGEIADLPTPEQFLKVAGPLMPDSRHTPAVKDIQIGQQDVQVKTNFELDLGKQLSLKIVDPEGNPLTNLEVDALWPRGQSIGTANAGPTVVVDGMWSKEKRLVLLHQKERNLGKALRVCWNDDGPGPVTVKLEPCATLKARLLDKNGDPVRGGTIRIEAETGNFALGLTDGATDRDGRLNYTTLLPGATYTVLCQSAQIGVQSVVENLTVSPGDTIDLGEFDVTAKDRPTPKRTQR